MNAESNEQTVETLAYAALNQLNSDPQQFVDEASRLIRISYGYIFLAEFILSLTYITSGVFTGLLLFNGLEHFSSFLPYFIPVAILAALFSTNPLKRLGQDKVRIRLNENNCPGLFAELAAFNAQQNIGRLPKVFLTDTGNGKAGFIPHFNFLRIHSPILMIGLECLLVMSSDQIRGLLAHEWGHLSNPLQRLATRLTHALITLACYEWVLTKLRFHSFQKKVTTLTIQLAAYDSALRYNNEYAADRIAAELVGSHMAGQSLMGTAVFNAWFGENYWKPLTDMTRHLANPNVSPYRDLYDYCRQYRFSQEELMATIQPGLKAISVVTDTHPSLGERLEAIQAAQAWTLPTGPCAAESWFGDALPMVMETMDQHWRKHYKKGWRKLHLRHRKSHTESRMGDYMEQPANAAYPKRSDNGAGGSD